MTALEFMWTRGPVCIQIVRFSLGLAVCGSTLFGAVPFARALEVSGLLQRGLVSQRAYAVA